MFTEGQQTVLAVTTVLYFLFLLGVSVWIGVRQIRTYDDFNVASRNVSLFPLILTYVGTAIGGSLLLGIMTNGYVLGMGQQWFNIMIFVVSVIMALFVIRRIRESARSTATSPSVTSPRTGSGPAPGSRPRSRC